MKGDKAITFKPETAQAVFLRRKVETRRPVVGVKNDDELTWNGKELRVGRSVHLVRPRYRIGDKVRVKEPYRLWPAYQDGVSSSPYGGSVSTLLKLGLDYRLEYAGAPFDTLCDDPWRQTRFMNDIFSRTRLTITDVRLERLQQIDEAGAKREGFQAEGWTNGGPMDPPEHDGVTALENFQAFWDHEIYTGEENAELRWDADPWVWVYAFEVI